jgi:hypothetical protein
MAAGDLAMSIPHIRDPNTEAGTGEKVLSTLGRSTGYLLGGRMGMLGSTALGSGLGYLGGKAGKLVGGGGVRGSVDMGPRAELLSQAAPEAGRLVGID